MLNKDTLALLIDKFRFVMYGHERKRQTRPEHDLQHLLVSGSNVAVSIDQAL